MDPIGPIIRRQRSAAGITQVELANRTGLRQSAISEIESGKRKNPRYDTVQKLLGALRPDHDRPPTQAEAA